MSAPFATLIVGLAGIIGVIVTLMQRSRSESQDREHRVRHDARIEWWRRYQWAAEQANQDGNPQAEMFGRAVLNALADEQNVTDSEVAILRAVAANFSPGA